MVKRKIHSIHSSGCPKRRSGGKVAEMVAPHDTIVASFLEKGWHRFPFDSGLMNWIHNTLPAARRAVAAPENAHWLRCGGTWFVGVNTLPNDTDGAVGHGPELSGVAVDAIHHLLGTEELKWDRAQLSVCYPGYPQRMDSESESAHRYRLERDAAHVDGLLAEGERRRRHLREYHAFILGIPLLRTDPDASPLVVWEGSQEIVRASFREAFAGAATESWCDIDITDVYHATRRRIFEHCRRREIAAAPGEAYLIHRLALHGVAPWRSAGTHSPEGRMVCYFRPEIGEPGNWLLAP